jgi:hypothetical protein
VRPGRDDVDDAQWEHRPATEVEHVSDLHGRRDVADAEVVAPHVVDADGDANHDVIVAAED